MKFSEYIRQCQELLAEYEDAEMIFDDDTPIDEGNLPSFVEDSDGKFWVVDS